MDSFQEGSIYSFDVLTEKFGRSTSYVFRNKKDKVTAFILKKEMNPSTEDGSGREDIFILVAKGSLRESIPGGLLLKREYPVFVQEDKNKWRYLGTYFYLGMTKDQKVRSEHARTASVKLDEIEMVLTLKKSSAAIKVAA